MTASRMQIEALKVKFPYLIPYADTNKYHGHVLAAKNIRIELKRAFSGVKFSVTSKSFSMGNDVNIDWTDGPTMKQVEAITGKYQEGDFDGMTDCYNYDHSQVWTDVFGGAKYVFESRSFSDKLASKAILKIANEYGIKDLPTVDEYKHGNAYGTPMSNTQNEHYWTWQSLINRTAGEITL